MAFSRTTYTRTQNRGKVGDKIDVSREELADFRRKYGANLTLRDLLNYDRTGKLPKAEAKAAPKAEAQPAGRAEIPGAGPYKAPASTGEGVSETRRNIANIVSALPAARAVSMAGKAAQTASAGRAASEGAKRITPMLATSRNAGTGKFRDTQGALKESTEAAMKSRSGPEMGAGAKPGPGRVEPMLSTSRASDSGKFRKSDVSLKEATEAAKKGRTEPTFKKGGSVRGGGCEARSKKTRYV